MKAENFNAEERKGLCREVIVGVGLVPTLSVCRRDRAEMAAEECRRSRGER